MVHTHRGELWKRHSDITAIFPGGPRLVGTRILPFCILMKLMMMEVLVCKVFLGRNFSKFENFDRFFTLSSKEVGKP